MATSAQLEAAINSLSNEQYMQLRVKLSGNQLVQLVTPALLSQTQLDALCAEIAAVYPPLAEQLTA